MGDETNADPAVKPGIKTTEFWLTLIANLVGALALLDVFAPGSTAAKIIAGIGMVLSNLGYIGGRTLVKTAGAMLVAIALPLILGGCTKGYVSADAIAPLVEDVSTRHDKLVQKAADISDQDKATYLRSTELLRKAISEAKK